MSNPSSESAPARRASAQPEASDAVLRLLDRPSDPADLVASADLSSLAGEPGGRQAVRILLFRVGDETAALPAGLLRRVTPLARPTPIPHRRNGVVRGVCNIRGEIVLCADLHRLLGLPARAETGTPGDAGAGSRRMVVVGPGDNSWTFEVDALMGVESVDPATFRAPPLTVEHAIGVFTQSVTDIDGRTITILDGQRILAGFKAGLA